MAESFQLEIVTPAAVIDCGQVDYLRAPGSEGLFGIKARHTRMMAGLSVGAVKVISGGKEQFYATGPGYADVQGRSVQLLVESAEEAGSIDADRAKSAAARAKDRLKQHRDDNLDAARAEAALMRATNRLSVVARG